MQTARSLEAKILVAAIGPVWTAFGFRNWSLLLGDEVIVAFPYTFLEAIELNARFNVRGSLQDAGAKIRQLTENGLRTDELPAKRAVRRYEIYQIRKIELVSSYMQNRIRIITGKGADAYSIAYRQQTTFYREILKRLYPVRYAERNFPTSRLGRVLKS